MNIKSFYLNKNILFTEEEEVRLLEENNLPTNIKLILNEIKKEIIIEHSFIDVEFLLDYIKIDVKTLLKYLKEYYNIEKNMITLNIQDPTLEDMKLLEELDIMYIYEKIKNV